MEYSQEELRQAQARYLAKVIAAYMCAPPEDDDEQEEDEEIENGIST